MFNQNSKKPIRTKLTITSHIVETLNVLKPADRLLAIDLLFNHFFYGEDLFAKECPDAVSIFLSICAPEIRMLDTKYNNPKGKKRSS